MTPARSGAQRFTDYGPLRPPGLPSVITPSPAARRAADRSAAQNVARNVAFWAAAARRARRVYFTAATAA
ncbi:DUF6255 family natural product biosynthesis protein [Streptomyces triculaminicus]|uniref:DUF6255 family natural product biosynthesis protein n=1 Tax=Streptomyces triculaminicus TaxID=2816232 RepID=UPI0037D7A347